MGRQFRFKFLFAARPMGRRCVRGSHDTLGFLSEDELPSSLFKPRTPCHFRPSALDDPVRRHQTR